MSAKETVQVEIETKTLNNIILLTVIILNNANTKKQPKIDENHLYSYIELFFKNSERNSLVNAAFLEDLEESSTYSTVSSILGIQTNKLERIPSKQEYEM